SNPTPTSPFFLVGAEKPSVVFHRSSKLRSARTSAVLRVAQTPCGVCRGHPWPGIEHEDLQAFEAFRFKTLQLGITDFTPLHQLFRRATPFFMFNFLFFLSLRSARKASLRRSRRS